MVLVGLGLAALIGLSLGLLGGGGSILTVPIFVYVLGFGAKEAIAMSLAVVGAVSLFGAAGHWRAGNVNPRVGVVFGGVAMLGTYLGARLAVYFSGGAQLALFALVMLLAAFFMLRERPRGMDEECLSGSAAPVVIADASVLRGAVSPGRMPLGPIVLEGLGVGVLTGLVGVGGGFLIVPALVVLGKVPMKQAVGTSLVVIAMKSAAGFFGYLGQVNIPWAFMTLFTGVAAIGIVGGTYLVRFVPQDVLKRAFALFLVVMGGFILYQNRAAYLPGPPGQPPAIPAEATGGASESRVEKALEGVPREGSTSMDHTSGGRTGTGASTAHDEAVAQVEHDWGRERRNT